MAGTRKPMGRSKTEGDHHPLPYVSQGRRSKTSPCFFDKDATPIKTAKEYEQVVEVSQAEEADRVLSEKVAHCKDIENSAVSKTKFLSRQTTVGKMLSGKLPQPDINAEEPDAIVSEGKSVPSSP